MRTSVKRFGVVGLIAAFLAAYAAVVVLYARSGAGSPQAGSPVADEVTDATRVTMTAEEIQTNYTVLVVNLTVTPGSHLLDPLNHHLKEDLRLRVTSTTTPTLRTWTKGMLPGVFPVPLTLSGHINRWPLDLYHSGPIEVQLFHGGQTVPERVPVTFANHLFGWEVGVGKADPSGRHQVHLRRSLSSAAFGIVILGVLIAIAGLGLFVAIQTVRDRRKFQPPMTTWYAAMLFAVVPLRNALPGSPPFGGWIDITIVVWVLVVLVISMLLYITCWWRHLRPDG
ncbi:DUF4436 domain-containing protein [Mycobacterium riyadhense]|uniref:DUF4436 domain-containing protein n=1 Tax=Mycobacterium riyadhense TaxID=486698 RepID=A0A1X2D5G7_9MYCO|nr:DUF4436 domain-containing protein [Mycobacterium riyadhense]MCV7146501.1 DUF4436 domain-containing protein [Mycobacterium riyadhense]ORW83154.1 hypothetical protein AWC22_15450 [Mycobacterium riyadhense]VTO96480.1 hypothetical protein BIN_B_01546 [Mycobacterium riyadhense]